MKRTMHRGFFFPSHGMTLLETLIALSIAAMIARYVVPIYHDHMARGYRQMVVLALLSHAAHLEMNAPPNGIAQTASTVSGNTPLTRRAGATIDRVPPQGKAAYHLQTSATRDGPSRSHATGGAVSRYVIEGVPLADGPMRDDPCGIFVLTAEGRRTNRTAAGTVLSGVDGCWSGTRLRHR